MTAITDDLPARLLHEENAGWEAIVGGHGGAYYQREMTDDGLMIMPGAVIGRDQVAAYFDQAAPWESYSIHEPAIIRLGDRAGVVVYRAAARRGAESVELNVSTTYLFVNGGWRVAARQQSPV